MAGYQKNKSENYASLGGMNTKVSQYLTKQTEFLNLQSLDFRKPGALSSFPGSTHFFTGSASGPITGIVDFFLNFHTGQIGVPTYCTIATDNTSLYNLTSGSISNVYSYLYAGYTNRFSFVRGEKLFACNQYDFFIFPKINGDTTFPSPVPPQTSSSTYAIQYSLPPPVWSFGPVFSGVSNAGGFTGVFNLAAAFVRGDGFVGPASYLSFTLTHGYSTVNVNLPTLPQGFGVTTIGFTNWDIVGMFVWFSDQNNQPIIRQNQFATDLNPGYLASFPTYSIHYGAAGGSYSDSYLPEDYFGTYLYGFPNQFQGLGATAGLSGNFNPATIDQYANKLWAGGFLNNPDTVSVSQDGEFEKHDNDATFEVRAKDGDIVSCIKAYFTQLLIAKVNSLHAFNGTDLDSGSLVEVSTQYGILNAKCACIWEQHLWFIDKKGVCEYNGANTQAVSTQIEDIFKRMNISAARITAQLIHVKQRNEIWALIPIDGSPENNIICFYDYVSQCWGTRPIPSTMTCFSEEIIGDTNMLPFWGTSAGVINQFGQSLTTDFGTGFTCLAKTRFIGDMGHSVEKMFRRLYLDVAATPGTTFNVQVNMYTNQGATMAYSTTMPVSAVLERNRIDFGLPARDLSLEFIYSGGTFLQLNGFTIEYRFQRSV